MNLKLLHSWLLEYLDTKATPTQIAKYLSLCGSSVEKVERWNNDYLYSIEVTTNRVDSFSVYGIAKEASAILPRFKIPAKLKSVRSVNNDHKFVSQVDYLKAVVDPKLCYRFTAVLIKDVKTGPSPDWMKNRLEASGVRSINNVVDVSNYIMLTLGQPIHTFDYDKIIDKKMIVRLSKPGEKITTLDKKEFKLQGGDIVIEDGGGRLIDLAGIMGGDLSKVDDSTKNVLLFVQTYNPVYIRKTSMALAQRSIAASIFEKGADTELVNQGMIMGIDLFKKITKGVAEREIIDIYPNPPKPKKVLTSLDFIQKRLGCPITKSEVASYLNSLDFKISWEKLKLEVTIPSFRSNDLSIEEDVVEEVARIYGYHNLPSVLMGGHLPGEPTDPIFEFENAIKNILKGFGGIEVYTLSLVSADMTDGGALKLKNPLGDDTSYLRTSLMPSIVNAASENLGTFSKFHLFEMANVYIPQKSDLPDEKLILAGIFSGYEYRSAKGIVEALLDCLNIDYSLEHQELKGYSAGKSVVVLVNKESIGSFGIIENADMIYYEFEVNGLMQSVSPRTFIDVPKYPVQIEDITLTIPEKTYIGEVVKAIYNVEFTIHKVKLKDVFADSYTFNIEYQDPNKTLTDKEVEEIRKKILTTVKSKFGAVLKS